VLTPTASSCDGGDLILRVPCKDRLHGVHSPDPLVCL